VIGRRGVELSALVCVLAFPAGAQAATVSLAVADTCDGDPVCLKYGLGLRVPVTLLAGAPGEANRITVTTEGRPARRRAGRGRALRRR
jgi:hypothetical protein